MGNTLHPGPQKKAKLPAPEHWVSPIPFGLGKIKPKHIRDTMKIAWDNRDNLGYATNIRSRSYICGI